MSEERHVEHTEHVETSAPAEEHVVETAQAAVALAETVAAEAEIDAAERVREWQQSTTQTIQNLDERIAAFAAADSARERALEERLTLLEQTSAAAISAAVMASQDRLTALEARLPQSIPEPSTEAEPQTAEPALVGTEGTVQLGPAEATAGASLGGSESAARKRRKWI